MSRSRIPRGIVTAPAIVPLACSSGSRTSMSVKSSPDCCMRTRSSGPISCTCFLASSTICLNSGNGIHLLLGSPSDSNDMKNSSGLNGTPATITHTSDLRECAPPGRYPHPSLLSCGLSFCVMTTPTPTAISPAFDRYLLEVTDAVNTTLDLNTLLQRIAEMLKRLLDYEIFAILLLNEQTQELKVRFQVGHPPEVAERIRIKVGQGVTGQAALRREAVLVNDVSAEENFINSAPGVHSELAVPLIAKNKVIGVLDVEAAQANAFTEEHKHLLTLFASRIAAGIENARLYTRVARQARQLTLLTA